ncbi:hypothetical protein N7454_002591 [Penicillium verhagenii]|nr:hypothetical protein N7454_002591 [Penicillium verhagenii]
MPSTANLFHVIEHVVPCQYIREYPGATINGQTDLLKLSVKQYIPIDNLTPQHGDVTILAAHANGLPKELYEPLWDDLYRCSKSQGFRIRAIWIADVVNQGQSGVLNEGVLGNDSNWFDHSRDLLHLVNLKQSEMPQPIIGVGHSMGGFHLAHLSLMHPRLLHSIILIDPIIQRERTPLSDNRYIELSEMAAQFSELSIVRRDQWPSRKAAAESFQRSRFYHGWDPRVLEQWIKFGLRDTPTMTYPLHDETLPETDADGPPVTLTTTRHQEVFSFTRPIYDHAGCRGSHETHPDLDKGIPDSSRFYRPEPPQIFAQLPFLRPSIFYIFGGRSNISIPALRADKIKNTGTGLGGSGGVANGRVREAFLEQAGHLIPQETPRETAELISLWLRPELDRWQSEDEAFRALLDRTTTIEKVTACDKWTGLWPNLRPQRREKKATVSML